MTLYTRLLTLFLQKSFATPKASTRALAYVRRSYQASSADCLRALCLAPSGRSSHQESAVCPHTSMPSIMLLVVHVAHRYHAHDINASHAVGGASA
eukprot:11068123-Heterocapsa_arctica.AAC.1